MISHIKNIVIVGLVVCAVYLTGKLWFDEISNHNFFYTMLSVFSSKQPEADIDQNYFIKPARIVTGFGDGTFDILYNGMESSHQKKNSDEAITAVLSQGQYIGQMQRDLKTLLQNGGYAYSYAADMPSTVFVKNYLQKRNILTSKVKSFNWIFIQNHPNSNISVIFFDKNTGRAFEYSINNVYLESRIADDIAALQSAANRMKYVYDRNYFIAQVPEEGFSYPLVTLENQYMEQGGLLIDYIKKKINVFFKNSGSKWETTDSRGFTYSDENTVVKYYPSEYANGLDVLEYSNYHVLDNKITTLAADYNTAMSFISRDATIENEIYLAGVETSETKRTFYFNFAINDLPVSISYVTSGQIGLEHPIEIVLESGVVTKYRKLVYRFTSDASQPITATTAFESVINDMLEVGESPDDLKLDTIALNYKIDVNNELALYWFLDLGGTTYVKSAQSTFR